MTYAIVVFCVFVVCVLAVLFVVYPWSKKGESQILDAVSRIVVEVWYFDTTDNNWKFWEDVTMAEWMGKKGRFLSEIDLGMAEKYVSANWIAWKDDSTLPKPAEFINRDDFEAMYKPDLSGPYGCPLFDDQVIL